MIFDASGHRLRRSIGYLREFVPDRHSPAGTRYSLVDLISNSSFESDDDPDAEMRDTPNPGGGKTGPVL